MHMTGAPGVGLDESARVGAATARTLLAVPGVRSVAQVIGRSTLSEDTFGPERSEMMVQLEPGVNAAAVSAELRARTAEVAGFAFDLKQFLNERIEELLGGVGAALVVRLRGPDLPSLEQAAATVSERLAVIPGVADLHAPGALAASGIRVKPRRADLLGQQVSAAAVERALRAALGGLPVGRIVEGERQAEVVLRVAADGVLDPERLARLPIAGGHGRVLPLGAVADVEGASLRTAITHEDGVRTVLVRLDARGRSLEAVALDVARAVAAAPLPAGVYAEVGGECAAAAAARARLVGLGARAGGEIEQPMAVVIVGGLVSSTWLNLFVVPVWYARRGARRR